MFSSIDEHLIFAFLIFTISDINIITYSNNILKISFLD